ncbi:flavin reductase [Acrocarpospora catenulata]|uniref:flavin reductase n=1 Tax=Acrocarpospora catenulata TaxID=2836182 RepID=UPI001BD9E3FD|nr:flavin reductase [Acrocarpospora catenulata]
MERTAGPVPAAVDALLFRHVVGHLATGVTVLTTAEGHQRFGMTASSVTSLSVDPPTMLACINNAVPTAAAVARAGKYVVNVLGEDQSRLAHQFAAPGPDKFRDVRVHTGELGLPVLTDALAHLECEVTEQVDGGTHSVFIGRVRSAVAGRGSPLTYYRGDFGRFEFARDDRVYKKARHQVLSRVYPANEVILLDDLADELGVDPSAAFYALTRLAADGLVRRDPDRGYVVTQFDVTTSDATFDARLAIELGVIELSVGRAAPEELAELRARFERMAVLLVGDRFVDFDDYLDANYAFHEWLVGLAHNPLLTATFGGLSIKSVMTRSFGSTPVTSQKFIDVQRDLTEAFERADAAAARASARAYCTLAKQRVREILAHTGGRL